MADSNKRSSGRCSLEAPAGYNQRSDSTDDKYLFYATDGQGRQFAGNKDGYDQTGEIWYYQNGGNLAGGARNANTFGIERQAHADAPGLSFFRNRFYDQKTGRWTQEDPIGVAGGTNLYAYVGNNPVAYTDPFGLCPPADNNRADCPGGGGQVRFFGIAGNLIVGAGYTAAVGRLCNDDGCAWYARAGVGAGLDVNIGTEGGSSDSLAAFSGDGEAACGGASIVNVCQGSNSNGSTTSAGGQIGPTEITASGHGEKTHTWVSKIEPRSKPHNYFDCSQPQPQASVCNR